MKAESEDSEDSEFPVSNAWDIGDPVPYDIEFEYDSEVLRSRRFGREFGRSGGNSE
jgi:hypothetical protein